MALTRDVAGLIFRDQFDDVDQNVDGYNGWAESHPGSYQLVSEIVEARWASSGNKRMAIDLGDQGTVIMQVNSRRNNTTSGPTIDMWANAVSASNLGGSYRARFEPVGNSRIIKTGTGDLDSGDPSGGTSRRSYRLVIDTEASPIEVRAYDSAALVTLQDLNEDPTLLLEGTDAGVRPTDGFYGILYATGSGGASRDLDEFFICGRNIVVSGLPTGWKVQLDARAAVVESGGEVTLDVDAWALPGTTLRILDSSDVEQESITPSGGVWGGDEYSTDAVPLSQPDTPALSVVEVGATTVDLAGSAFNDPDGHFHAASQWQVDVAGGGFAAPVFDSGEDGVNLEAITATGLAEITDHVARVRYKDDSGDAATEWSEWSAAVSFRTGFTGALVSETRPTYLGTGAQLAAHTDHNQEPGAAAILARLRSLAVAPGGAGGEAIFTNLYLALVAEAAAVVDVTPILDGKVRTPEKVSISVPAPPSGLALRRRYEIGLMREFGQTLEQESSGLLFRDQFNRADADPVDGGWTETGATETIELSDNRIFKAVGSGAGVQQDLGIDPATDVMLQVNVSPQADAHGATLWAKGDVVGQPLPNGYLIDSEKEGFSADHEWMLRRATNATPGFGTVDLFNELDGPSYPQGNIYSLRGVVRGTLLQILHADVSSLSQLNRSFELIGQVVDDDPPDDLGGVYGFRVRASTGSADEFFVCGPRIQVKGLPAGWTIETEFGITGTPDSDGWVDVSTWPWPATTLFVFDEEGVQAAAISPSAGVWGGDVYQFHAVSVALRGTWFAALIEAKSSATGKRVEVEGVEVETEVVTEGVEDRPFHQEGLQLRSTSPALHWFVGVGSELLEGSSGVSDNGATVTARAETVALAPAGVGGEAIFTNLYLAIQRDLATDLDLTITPILDGVDQEPQVLTLEATATPVRQVHELGLSVAYPSAAAPEFLYAMRGTWFSVRIETAEALPAGRVEIDGVDVETEVVIEGEEAANAS